MAVTNNFSNSTLDLNGVIGLTQPTALVWGPDGRLYITEVDGDVKVLTVEFGDPDPNDNDDTLGFYVSEAVTLTQIKEIQNHNDTGVEGGNGNARQVTGIDVTPQFDANGNQMFVQADGSVSTNVTDTPAVTIYVTSSDSRKGAGSNGGDLGLDTNSGMITKLTQVGEGDNENDWDAVDIVRGLPRSEENHATNGLEVIQELDANGNLISERLIVAQGGNANTGAPSNNFAGQEEQPLSAAILEIDLDAINDLSVQQDPDQGGRQFVYDIPTLNDPAQANGGINDPFGGNDSFNSAKLLADGPVQIYAPGFRNPYDVEVTEDGRVWTYDNGANNNWGGRPVGEAGDNDPANRNNGTNLSNLSPVDNQQDAGYIATNLNNGEGNDNDSISVEAWNPSNRDNFHEVTRSDDLNGGSLSVGGNGDVSIYTDPDDNLTYVYGGHPNPTRAEASRAGILFSPKATDDDAFLLVSNEDSFGNGGDSDFDEVTAWLAAVEADPSLDVSANQLQSRVLAVTPGVLYDIYKTDDGGIAVPAGNTPDENPPADSIEFLGQAGLPSDISEIVDRANPIEGDYKEAGRNDGALDTGFNSINGLAEYTSTVLDDGSTDMSGAILATQLGGGNIIVMGRNADGTLTSTTDNLGYAQAADRTVIPASGGPLGITTIGDDFADQGLNKAFQGSIWTAVYQQNGGVFIEVFQPDIAEIPQAGSEVVDENDQDLDGVDKFNDPFEFSADNGYDLDAGQKIIFDFSKTDVNPLFAGSLEDIGFFGAALDGSTPNQDENTADEGFPVELQQPGLFNIANLIPGGNAPILQIKTVEEGSVVGSGNTARDALHTAINPSADTGRIEATLAMANWIPRLGVNTGELSGLMFGDGTQSNFLRVVFGEVNGVPGIEVGFELNDANYTTVAQLAVPGLSNAANTEIDVRLSIDIDNGYAVSVFYRLRQEGQSSGDFIEVPLNDGTPGFSLPPGILQDVLAGGNQISDSDTTLPAGAAFGVLAEDADGATALDSVDFLQLEIEAFGNEINASTAAEVAAAGTAEVDTVIYDGVDTDLTLNALAENFDGSPSDADFDLTANGLDNTIVVGSGENAITTGDGADRVEGKLADFANDEITDFSEDDELIITDAGTVGTTISFSGDGEAIVTINGTPITFSGPDFADFDPATGDQVFSFEDTPEGLRIARIPALSLVTAVNTGTNDYTYTIDGIEVTFLADAGGGAAQQFLSDGTTGSKLFSGGAGADGAAAIQGTNFGPGALTELHWVERSAANDAAQNLDFGYAIPVADGVYRVDVYMAEIFHGVVSTNASPEGDRVFNILVEDALVQDDLDIVESAGGTGTELKLTYEVEVTDGVFNIDFDAKALGALTGETDQPKLSGFALYQVGGTFTPPADTTAPTIESVTVANDQNQTDLIRVMTVVLTDNQGFDAATVAQTAPTFTGVQPDAVSVPTVVLSNNGQTATLTYELTPPANSWPRSAVGTIEFAAGAFQDAAGNTSTASSTAFVVEPFLDQYDRGDVVRAINIGTTDTTPSAGLNPDPLDGNAVDNNRYGGAIASDSVITDAFGNPVAFEADDNAYHTSPKGNGGLNNNVDGQLGDTGSNAGGVDLDGSAYHTYRDSSAASWTSTFDGFENGAYIVELHFAELFHGGPDARVGDFTVNGVVFGDDYDAYVEGGSSADAPSFIRLPVIVTDATPGQSDGTIQVDVSSSAGQAGYSAIVVYDAIDPNLPPTISVGDVEAVEGGDATVTFTRIGDDSEAVTVNFTVAADTADNSDFGAATPSSPVIIPAGQGSVSITIPIADDDEAEVAETFTVTIDSVSNTSSDAVIEDGSATVTISSSDNPLQSAVPDGGKFIDLGFDDASAVNAAADTGFSAVLGPEATSFVAGDALVEDGLLKIQTADGDLSLGPNDASKNDFVTELDLSSDDINEFYVTAVVNNPFDQAFFDSLVELDPDPNLVDGVVPNFAQLGIVIAVDDPATNQNPGNFLKLIYGGNGGNATQVWAQGNNAQQIVGTNQVVVLQTADGTNGAIANAADSPFNYLDVDKVELSLKIDKAAGTYAQFVTFFDADGNILGGVRPTSTDGFATAAPQAIPPTILDAINAGNTVVGITHNDFEQTPMGVAGYDVPSFEVQYDSFHVSSPDLPEGTDSVRGTVVGDFSEDGQNPTDIDLLPGSNVIQSTQQGDDAPGGRDYDYYTIVVPEGQVLSQILVTDYQTETINGSFVGLIEGDTFPAPPTSDADFPGLAAQLLGGAIVDTSGVDILALMAGGTVQGLSTQGFTVPLPAGTYTVWHSQNGPQTTISLDYQLTDALMDAPVEIFVSLVGLPAADEDGDVGTTDLSFGLSLSDNTFSGDLDIAFDTGDQAGQTQTVTFTNGNGFLTIPVDNDDMDDGDDVVAVTLTGATSQDQNVDAQFLIDANFASGSGTVFEDDTPPFPGADIDVGKVVLAINSGPGGAIENDPIFGIDFVADEQFSTPSGTYTDGQGGSDPFDNPALVGSILETERGGAAFDYTLTERADGTPLVAGEQHVLELIMSEIFFLEAEKRVFDVVVNGAGLVNDLDIVAEVGVDNAATAEVEGIYRIRTLATVNANGEIVIDMAASTNNAKLSGLVLYNLPLADGTVTIADAADKVEEGDTGDTVLEFPLTLAGPDATVTVEYTVNGEAMSTLVGFVDGAGILAVPVSNDNEDNGPETIDVILTGVTEAGFGIEDEDNTASATVTEDELPIGTAPGEDLDNDGIANATDEDVDGDGASNAVGGVAGNVEETFIYDADNEGKVLLPGEMDILEFDTDGTPFQNGLTGVLVSPKATTVEYDAAAADVSGGSLNISASNGDHFNNNNTQQNAFVAGYQAKNGLVVETRFVIPTDWDSNLEGDQASADFQSAGVVIGVDQNQLVKFVYGRGPGEFELAQDHGNGGSPTGTATGENTTPEGAVEVIIRVEAFIDDGVAKAKGIYTFLDGNGQPIPSFTDMEVGPITLNDNGSDANAIDSLKEVIEAGSTVGAGVIQTSTNATADNFDVSYQYLKVTSLTNPADIDDDDVDNTDDPFAYDGNNGLDKVLTPGTEFTQDFNFDANDLPTSAFDEEVGFTGILVNPDFTYPGASEEDPYGNRTVEENVSFDGERISITSSDEDANALPNGQGVPNTSRANTLRDGYQSGVDVTNVDRFEVVARGNSAELITTISTGGFEQFGIQFGAGGVDDFIKLVVGDAGSAVRVQLADNNGYVGDEVNSNIVNNNGTPGPVGVDLASVGDIVFRLQVDKSAGANGQVTGVVEFYDIVDGTNLLTFTTETVDLEPDTAIQSALAGNNSLTGGEGGIAYGFFVTDSGGADAPGAITANFDYLTIRALDTISVSIAAPAEAIDEAGDDGVTTLEFPLTASDSYNATFNVLYTVNNGEQESQEVTFVDGQGVLSIDVPADDLVDADDINVLLTGTANDEFAVLDPANLATGTITEDDAAPAVDQGIVGQSAQETVAYSFDVPADAFGDADTADLTLTAFQVVDGNNVALPSWLGFDGTSFTGTPLEADIGASYTIKVIADDGTNPTAETTFTLDVTRFNEAPVVTPPNPAAVMFDENSTEIVADFDATDVDPEDQDPGDVTFILGGDDAAAFEINDAGELSFVDAPNHDDPQDLNGDNVYDITVSATDGIATSTPEAFSVTINDLDEEVQTADDPADLPGEGIGSPDETETVVYTGSEDVGTPETPYVLPTDVENFDATGTGSVNVSGNAEDNMIGVGLGADDTVDLSAGGSDTVAGSAQELDGTSVDEFGIDDAISVEGTEAAEVMSVGPGSAELGIDTDGDGEVNTTVIIENLDGANLTPAAFEATSDGNGNTEITFIGDTFRFQAEDATLNGYVTTPQGGADNLATIRLPNGTGTGTATFDLSGTNVIPGTYTVTIGYFDETDGEGSIGIQVGDLDETFDLNDTSGSSQPNSISFRTKRFVDVVIGEDELVTITGIKDGANSGEEVRIDYIEFTLGEGDVTNNAPESQGAIDDIAINEGESITPIDLNTIIIDPEEDPLTFEVDGADWLSIDENGILSGTPSPIDAGMTFNVIVTGSDAPNSSATEEFTISVNAAPDASTIPNQSLQVSDTFDLDTSLFFTDAEGIEDLTFSVSGTLPTGVVFDEDTGVFSGTADGVGAFIITVTAEDMGGLSDSASFLLTVQGDDNRPTVRIEAEDFELTDLPGNDGFFVQANNRIALNTNGEGEAIYDFADSGIAEGAYDLRVTFWDENDGTSTAQVMVSQDGGATFTLLGDPDGDGNSIVFDQNGGGNALQQENIRSVTIPGLVVGPNTVLKYTGQRDAAEFLRTDFFELVPTGNQLNFAPTVDGSIDDIELGGIEETTVDLTGIFSDPEQDPLTYDVQLVSPVGGDEWLSVSGSTLVGTPTAPGTYEFFVTATDGPGNSGQSAGTSFTVTVPDNNMAPTVSFNSGDQDALEDNAFETIMVLFEDPEGQAITYSLSEDSPAWLSIDEDSGVVTGTPTNADLGTLPVTIIGADPQGASAEVTVSVTVENTNDAPIAVTPVIPGQTVALAEQFTLPLPDGTFADEDPGDELSYSATLANGDPLPGFLQIDADTGELSGFPFAAGDIELTIIATDLAGESVSADFTVTVGSDVSAPDDVTLQAETFTLVDNYEVTPFPGAEEGEVVQLDVIAPGEISTDLSQFAGNSYTVAVRYVDETDGQASAVVKVDGVEVGSWVFDGQAGVQVNEGAATGGFSQPGNYRVVTFTTPFLVTDTSVLTIETQGQAGEFGRIDSIQLLGQVANTPATVLFFNEKEDLLEDADTSEPIKVADIVIGDDGLGTNTLALDLASQEFFEIGGDAQSGFELLLKAGVELDHETAATLSATVTVDDPEIAGAPDNSATVVIPVGNVLEAEDLLTPDGDLDQDMIANNVDPDIDGDGSLNEDDPFIYDADNGTLLGDGEKIDLTFDKTSTDLGLTGFTGFLQGKTATGGEPDAGGGGSFNEDTGAVSASGGQFIVDPVTSGDTGGMNNPQDDAQVGVKNDTFTIEAEVVNPWFGDAPNPDSFDQIGIFAGVDSSNMIKMVFGQTAGVVEVQSQVDGVGAKTGTGNGNIPLPAGAGLDDFATAFMRMEVELTGTQPNTATVTTFITFADENGQPLPGLTKVPFGSLTLTGSFADALADGNTAVGAGFTHVDGGFGSGTNVDFTATLNRFMVTEGISSDDVLPPSLTLDIEPLLTENDDLVITVTPSDDTSLPGDIALDGDELEVIGGGDNLQTPSSFVDNNNGTYTFTYEAPDGGWVEPISVQVLEDTFQDEAGNFNGPSDPQLVSIGLDPLDPSNPNYVNNLLTSLTDADGIATGGSYDNNATGSVVLDVLAGKNNIQVSNFGADSFKLTNTGDKKVAAVFIDFRDSILSDSVVDFDGSGGDTAAKVFAVNTDGIDGTGQTGIFFDSATGLGPSSGAAKADAAAKLADNDPFNDVYYLPGDAPLPNTTGAGITSGGGYKGLLVKFGTDNGGFENGEIVGFSGDMDPNSIAGLPKSVVDSGATNGWDVGGISGAEVAGSKFVVLFDDGTTAEGTLTSDGSGAGTIGRAVQGGATEQVGLSVNNGSGVYGLTEPDIIVTGDPGQVVQVTLTKGFQPVTNDSGSPTQTEALIESRLAISSPDFQVNNFFDVQTISLTIGANGQAIVPPGAFQYSTTLSGESFPGDDVQPILISAVAVDFQGFAIGDVQREALTNQGGAVVDVEPQLPGFFEANGLGGNNPFFKIQIEDVAALNGGIDPNGNWNYVTAPDSEGRQAGFQGNGYYLYGSNTSTGINGVAPAELLEFQIDIPEELVGEVLNFRIRASRDGLAAGDQQNDAWLGLTNADGTGSIEEFLVNTGGNEPEPVSSGLIKVFGGPNNGNWGYATNFDGVPGNPGVDIEFDEPGKYILQIGGRSQGFHIDWIELYVGNAPGEQAANSTFVPTGPQPVSLVDPIEDITIADGETGTFQVPTDTFNDPNGDPIDYSVSISTLSGPGTGVGGVSINEGTGLISGLNGLAIGTYEVIVTAETQDPLSQATDTFVINVVDEVLLETIEISVDAAGDDYEEKGGGTSGDLELGDNGGPQRVGIRFDDIDIPAGATITDAYIEFEALEDGSGAANFSIGIEDSENAGAFASPADLLGRPIDGTEAWTNVEAWVDGQTYRTPNLKDLIEGVIGGDGISDGALAFLIDPTSGGSSRVAVPFGGPGAAPKLVIEFGSTGGGGNTAPVVINDTIIPDVVPLTEGDPAENYNLDNVFDDAEDNDLDYSVSGAGAQFVSISGSTLMVNAPSPLAATEVTVTATDDQGLMAEETFTLSVAEDAPDNTDPVVEDAGVIPASVTLTEGDPSQAFDLNDVFQDAEDGDNLTYSVSGAGAQFVSISNSTLTVNAPAALAATTITVTAFDSALASVSETFTLTVQSDGGGVDPQFVLAFDVLDGNAVEVDNLPDGGTIDLADFQGNIEFTGQFPGNADPGSLTLEIKDSGGNTVASADENGAPFDIPNIDPNVFAEGAYTLEYTVFSAQNGQTGSILATNSFAFNVVDTSGGASDFAIDVGLTEAEDLELSSAYSIESRGNASGGELAKLSGAVGTAGTVTGSFVGDTGVYDVTVEIFNETDGESPFTLIVNGNGVGTFIATGPTSGAGTGVPDSFTFSGVSLSQGDTIAIESEVNSGSNGGTELGRIDAIDIVEAVAVTTASASIMAADDQLDTSAIASMPVVTVMSAGTQKDDPQMIELMSGGFQKSTTEVIEENANGVQSQEETGPAAQAADEPMLAEDFMEALEEENNLMNPGLINLVDF